MQSNLPQSSVYDDYTEFDDTHADTYDDEGYYQEESYTESSNDSRRVVWLMLMVLFVIILASVIVFWFMPYLQTVSLGSPPPLPPAVQT